MYKIFALFFPLSGMVHFHFCWRQDEISPVEIQTEACIAGILLTFSPPQVSAWKYLVNKQKKKADISNLTTVAGWLEYVGFTRNFKRKYKREAMEL